MSGRRMLWSVHAATACLVLVLVFAQGLLTPGVVWAEGGRLTPEEERVVAAVDALQDRAIGLLERTVNIPSATQNLNGVREVGQVFAVEFERAGFTTRWDALPAGMHRAGHLLAERKGTRGKRVLLIGHLDTVIEGGRFERVGDGNGSRARGIGASDMKGGDVILLTALNGLQAVGALDGRRLSAIFTGDEEDAGSPFSVSRASMVELARRSDVALAFEGASDNTAVVARRGVCSWTLKISSPTGHSSQAGGARLGPGAIFEAARTLEGFRAGLSGRKGLTFNASLFLGGTEVEHEASANRGRASGKTNVLAGTAVVEGDLRYLSNAQRAEAEALMRDVVARNLPRAQSELTFDAGYPAMAPTPGNHQTLAVLDQASRDLGLGPVKPFDPGRRGAGDISFVAPYVDGLDGLGAEGEGSHSLNESVNLDSLPRQARRAALLIYRLTHDETERAAR